MASSFHESFTPGTVKPPSERSTGLVFAVVALLIAFVRHDTPAVLASALLAAAALAFLSVFAPILLRPVNLLWFRFSMLLHKVVNPVVMFTIFAVVFVPGGLFMRLLRDPLQSRRRSDARTYWIERTEDDRLHSSMWHQF